jgi:hypothetical protein
MWYRSTVLHDELTWRAGNHFFAINSLYGRLIITSSSSPTRDFGNAGWSYHGRYFSSTVRDMWAPSFLKTVGIEFSREPPYPNSTSGYWIRVKWHLLLSVFAAFPILRWIWLRLRRERT